MWSIDRWAHPRVRPRARGSVHRFALFLCRASLFTHIDMSHRKLRIDHNVSIHTFKYGINSSSLSRNSEIRISSWWRSWILQGPAPGWQTDRFRSTDGHGPEISRCIHWLANCEQTLSWNFFCRRVVEKIRIVRHIENDDLLLPEDHSSRVVDRGCRVKSGRA